MQTDIKSTVKCAISLPASYYVTEHNYGLEGLQPYNFVLMNGTDLAPRVYESIVGHTERFGWLGLDGRAFSFNHPLKDIPQSLLRARLTLDRVMKNSSELQSKRLVIMSSTIKLRMSFLNRQLQPTVQKIPSGLV